jgi:sporulation protein YlmC with PRC-barrel domain
MSRHHLTASAAILALSLGLAPAALAQSSMSNSSDAAAGATESIKPDQMRASKIVGATVYDRDNRSIGSVKDLILDKSGKVDRVVVGVGGVLGVGDKNVAVSMSDVKFDNNRLTLDRTKAQLQQATNYRLENRDTGAGSSAVPVTGGTGGSRMNR